MDFSKLSHSNLVDFLAQDYSVYGIQPDPNLSQIKQAEYLFNLLQNIDEARFPLPVIDLYLAANYFGSRDQFYTPEEIRNLTLNQVQAFDQVFQFRAQDYDLGTNRKRIFRILKYLGLIFSPEQILLQPLFLEKICSQLSVGDLNEFRYAFDLIELSCSVSVYDPDRQIEEITPLNDQTFDLILKIDQVDGSAEVLIKASERGDSRIVQRLLEFGADPDLPDLSKQIEETPLMEASLNGHYEVVQILLKYKANPNLWTRYGDTALMMASRMGHEEVVRMLLKNGADPKLESRYGDTALSWASKGNHQNIVQILKEYILAN